MHVIALAAVLAGTMAVFGYLVAIWWLDRYEREPFWLTVLVFTWGALAGTTLAVLVSLPLLFVATSVGGQAVGTITAAVVIAPVVEEVTKGLVFILLLATHHLDNETDGLIYGAATGLGFAAVENLLYAVGAAADGAAAVLVVVFLRTFFSSIVHCISSGLLGMTIGHACHRSGPLKWLLWPALGLGLAVANHALWNALAVGAQFEVLGPASVLLLPLGMAIVALAAVAMFLLTQFSLWREHRVIRRFLLAEAALGVLPATHAAIIPFWLRRRKRDWLPRHVAHEAYLRATTLLAFRHHQLEVARGERRERYAADIGRLRREVRHLLGLPPDGASPPVGSSAAGTLAAWEGST